MLRKLAEYLGLSLLLGVVLMALLGALDPLLAAPRSRVLVAGPSKPTAATLPSPYMLDASTIAQVICASGTGTAVHLGKGEYVTAAHVVHGEKACWIGGKRVTIEHINIVDDWALIHADAYLPFRVVWSCERLHPGQSYFATGYAEGNPWPVTTHLIGYGYREDRTAYARGSIINGMSGGAVSDIDGVVHAINESRGPDGIPDGGVVELADVPQLCKEKH